MRLPIIAAALLATCTSAAASGFPVTVKSCNRDVTFDAAPKRAVSHDVNLTEMMLVLGLADRMVGYSGISGLKALDESLRERADKLPKLAPKSVTKEVLLGVDTDFFFAGWNYGMKVGGDVTPETLAPFDIAVYELTESCIHIMKKDKSSLQDMYADLLNLGAIFGEREKAEALVAGYEKELADFQASLPKLDKPMSVFIYSSGEQKPFTAGRYAMPTTIIEAAGGRNIVDDVESSWIEIGWEPVIEGNPEMVVIINYGEVTAGQKIEFMRTNPAFKDIDAVKNNRFFVLEYNEATPGPRNIAAIKRLATAMRAD